MQLLETECLRLRPLRTSDFADYFEYAQDPLVSGPGMWEPYESEAAAHADFLELIAGYDRGLLWWGLEHKADSKLIGRCELTNYDAHDARAEISYALNRDYWGQRLMTEAARCVLQHGFETMNLNRISAIVFSDNQASIRILQKLGMIHEGCLRQGRRIGEAFHDIDLYAILRAEYENSPSA